MHGRLKTRSTAEQQEIKRKEREKKVTLYKAGIAKVFLKRLNNENDEELLVIISQMLSANPDIYTLWNIRKEVLLHFKMNKTEEDMKEILEAELQLTEQCLRSNPKSYGSWHHRVWVLNIMPFPNWERELKLCNKYLELDERNFHCWDYRRIVAERSGVSAVEELNYSTTKIQTNFSNYSSWHYRSCLLPIVYLDPQHKRPIREDKHEEELELVQNAAFTDPNDQSAWFYQRWLLGKSKQPLAVVHAVAADTFVCVALTHCVSLMNQDTNIEVHLDGTSVPGVWRSSCNQRYSDVWWFTPDNKLIEGDHALGTVAVLLWKDGQLVHTVHLESTGVDGELTAHSKSQFGAQFSPGITSVLDEQLESCFQLLDLEPDSKWTLLTTVLLMQAIDRNRYKTETMEKLDQLLLVDTFRTGYYKDLRSKYVIEYSIETMEEKRIENSLQEIDLSGCKLTALYHTVHLSVLRKVDLSNNELARSLPQLHALQCCQILLLDNNGIESLCGMPPLPNLKTLSLRDNTIKSTLEIEHLQPCTELISVDLTGNKVEEDCKLEDTIKEILNSLTTLNGRFL